MAFWDAVLALAPAVLWKGDLTGAQVNDASGNARHGTIAAGITGSHASLIPSESGSPSLLGAGTSGHYIQRAHEAWMNPGDTFTAMVVIRPSSLASQRDIIGKLNSWQLWQETTGRLSFYILSGSWTALTSDNTVAGKVTVDNNYLVIIRKSGGSVDLRSIWINGVKVGEGAHTVTTATSALQLRMFGSSTDAARAYPGRQQGFAYWPGVALTDGEIAALYTAYQSAPPAAPGAFTAPLAGAAVTGEYLVGWGASVDADEYELELWDGTVWISLDFPPTNEYLFDTTGIFLENALLRVRSVNTTTMLTSAWVQSEEFTINPPSFIAPTLAQQISGVFNVRFTAVEGATAHELEVSMDGGETWDVLDNNITTAPVDGVITWPWDVSEIPNTEDVQLRVRGRIGLIPPDYLDTVLALNPTAHLIHDETNGVSVSDATGNGNEFLYGAGLPGASPVVPPDPANLVQGESSIITTGERASSLFNTNPSGSAWGRRDVFGEDVGASFAYLTWIRSSGLPGHEGFLLSTDWYLGDSRQGEQFEFYLYAPLATDRRLVAHRDIGASAWTVQFNLHPLNPFDGQPHSVGFIYDALTERMRVYYDGALIAEGDMPPRPFLGAEYVSRTVIGERTIAAGGQYAGHIQHSSIWFGGIPDGDDFAALHAAGTFEAPEYTEWYYSPLFDIFDIVNVSPPARKAWAFTLDGHVFYVIGSFDEMTLLYDSTTDQWCRWKTGDYQFWNMHRGTMWRGRVLAADRTRPIIWELDPSSMLDEEEIEIARAVTAFQPHRGDSSIRQGSMRMIARQQTGVAVDAVLTLRFSDDGGRTWSQPRELNLADATERLEFRSLGRIRKPGRIWEITDTGGLIRIDGAEGVLEDG